VSYITEDDMERARQMAPKMDETSQAILAASRLMGMMHIQAVYPVTDRKGKHHDVTGFFQRKQGRK